MRIIAGEAKGHRLKVPAGSPIRPSSERVRGAIFSILESAGVDLSRVLDLYAGTGAFGIEALSRGATIVDFVEQGAREAAAIQANLLATGLQARGRVHRQSVERALASLQGDYGVIFMDPPYAEKAVGSILGKLAGSGLTRADTLIIVEHSKHHALAAGYGSFTMSKERKYGQTVVSIYQREVIS